MPAKDFYKVLGVSKESSPEQLRKAYKDLSKKYHPDSNQGDASASDKFKEVQEAYAILGDAEKREQYDRYGAAFDGRGGSAGGPFPWPTGPGGSQIDLGDLFGGQIDLSELFGGGGFQGFGFGGGGGGRSGRGRAQARPQEGQDFSMEVDIPFTVAADGGEHGIQFQREGKVERLTVRIPAGVETGSVIRLAGQGEPGQHGGPPGDLLLTLKVAPHPWFRRDGRDLYLDLPLTPWEAVLGCKVDVPTLSEGNVTLTIPPGTSSGQKLRLRGKGVIDPKTKSRGDQYVVTKIVVPAKPDDQTQALYRQLSEIDTQTPRSGLW